jgi:hypothetical protein
VHLFPAVLNVSAFLVPAEWQSWVACRRNRLQLWNMLPNVLNKQFPMNENESILQSVEWFGEEKLKILIVKKIFYFIYDLEIADYCEKLTINYSFT